MHGEAYALELLGWDADWIEHTRGWPPRLEAARVACQQKHHVQVIGPRGTVWADIAGKLHHGAKAKRDLPVVGDWVGVEYQGDRQATVQAILPRRTSLIRQAAGDRTEAQLLSANVDIALVVSSMNRELNPRRLERFLAVVRAGGARPVIVLTKGDLVSEVEPYLATAHACAGDAEVLVASGVTGGGLPELRTRLGRGRTAVLLGSSGVGKSSLLNALAGKSLQSVADVRAWDDRGRHTTTVRQMLVLDDAVIIDTPGMREMQVWSEATRLDDTFDDIAVIAADCRFNDCQHHTEPDCAVRAAVTSGSLPPERLAAYQKVGGELDRHDARARLAHQAKERGLSRAIREAIKVKDRQ